MNFRLLKCFIVIFIAASFTLQIFAADTNSISATNVDSTANGILQLQAQLHEAQLQIEQSREENSALAQSNLNLMNTRIAQLEQTIATQRTGDAEAARRTQELILYLVAGIALAGLAAFLLAGYLQWRAFSQLAQITSRHSAMLGAAESVHKLAAPGRATVEVSNARLLEIVGQLERKIFELESGGKMLAAPATVNPIADGQKFLDTNEPQRALEIFEKILSSQPQNTEALVKKAAALEKLGRTDESLTFCDRAIAADNSFVVAYLQKGGLLNKLGRYEEALKCYEQAMVVQEKKPAAK